MAYALNGMLKIRVLREDRAATALTGARRARAAAESVRDEKRNDRTAFDATKDARRDRVYAAVMGRVVSMDALDRARDAVTRIDEESLLLAEAERKAQETLDEKSAQAESARIQFVAATKQKTKIDQHKALWEEEERRRLEQVADAEMEEFTGRRMHADDDDALD